MGNFATIRRKWLAETLEIGRRLPAYRAHFANISPNLDPFEQLRRLPILEREEVQRDPEAFRNRNVPSLEFHTSGSTGTPLTYYFCRRARWRRVMQYARFFAMHGCRPWHRVLSFKLLSDSSARVGSSWLDRSVFRNRKTVSALDAPVEQFRALREVDPHFLHGFPSTLEQLAAYVQQQNWRPTRLRRIFTASENVEPSQRRHLEEIFGAPVVDHYGAVEGFVAWECPRSSGYHINARSVFVEIVDNDGQPVPPNGVGRVLLTTLDNPAMPLLRYAIGDLAVASNGAPCPCGRTEPIFADVIGRVVDIFQFRSGPRSPWSLISRMREIDGLMRFQLVQTDADTVEIRYRSVENGRVEPNELRALAHAELGDEIRIELRETTEFQRLASGKFATALRLCSSALGFFSPAVDAFL
jgi:phenylacetate-CoA ligase